MPAAARTTKETSISHQGPNPYAAHALSTDEKEFLPFTPISDSSQAIMTTYPSRMRLGLTSLMQPLKERPESSKEPKESKADAGVARRRERPNYAEMLDFEDLEGGNSDSDDSSVKGLTARGRTLAAQRKMREEASATPRGTPPPQQEKTRPIQWKSYLGKRPPSNLIQVEPAKRAKHVYPPLEKLEEKAKLKAVLVPIKIELDTNTHKIRDCFMWNTAEPYITPEVFATTFCDDLGLSTAYRDQIVTLIKEQISDHAAAAEIPILTEDQEQDWAEADVRVIVNIDLQIQNLHLVDKIEWDLSSRLTPELFALSLCAELGLSGEAIPLISHAIHDELLKHKKECIDIGLIARPEGEERTSMRGPKRLEGIWRAWEDTKEFGPKVEELSLEDMEKIELEKEAILKRMRRNLAGQNLGPRVSSRKK